MWWDKGLVFNVFNTWGTCTQNATADFFSTSVRGLETAACNRDTSSRDLPCHDGLICQGKSNSGHPKLPTQQIRSICESLPLGTEGSRSYYLHPPPRTGSELKCGTQGNSELFHFPSSPSSYTKPHCEAEELWHLWTSQAFPTNFHGKASGKETVLLSRHDRLGYGGRSRGLRLQTLKGPLNSHLHKNIKPANCQTRWKARSQSCSCTAWDSTRCFAVAGARSAAPHPSVCHPLTGGGGGGGKVDLLTNFNQIWKRDVLTN